MSTSDHRAVTPATVIRALVVGCTLCACASAQLAAGMLSTSTYAQYASVPDAANLVPTNGFTIEAWALFTNALPGAPAPTIVRKSVVSPPSYFLRLQNYGNTAVFFVNKSGNPSELVVPIPNVTGAWHHLAGTWDGVTQRLYLDGIQVGQKTAVGTLWSTPGPLKIGEGVTNFNEIFTGWIDEVRLWSVVRTPAQLQADRFRELSATPGLVSAWRMNGNFQDSIGSNHGTGVGGATTVQSTSPVVGNYVIGPANAAIGAPLSWEVHSSQPGSIYVFDISVTGTAPGVQLGPPYSATVPLNPPWLRFEYGSALPASMFQDFLGVVPAGSVFHPIMNVPPLPALVGLPVSASFIALAAQPPAAISATGLPSTTVLGSFSPMVQTVTPPTSRQSGGIAIMLGGVNFQPGATVTFDDAPATNVVVNGSTSMTLLTPPGQLGPADITVTNPDGVTSTLAAGLTYVPDLVVTSVIPEPPVPGGAAQINGSGFAPGLVLTVNGALVPVIQVTPTTVSFNAPPSIACGTNVTVVNPDLQTATTSWNDIPTITYLFPSSGSHLGGGTFFTFGVFTPGTTVTVGGVPATIFASGPDVLLVEAPPGSPGPAPVAVVSTTGCAALSIYTYQ